MTTQATREETTVAIVGGGVAGLTAAMLLRRSGIDCVVLERQSRAYVEQRQRAGLVEYRGVRMFTEWGLGDLLGTFPADNTMEVRVDGEPIFVGRDAHAQEYVGVLTPQQALVRNLVAAFLDDGGDLRFEVADVAMSGLDSQRPVVSYTDGEGTAREIACDLIAGCDGDHGVSRGSIPAGVLTAYTRDYNVTWLAVLADTPPLRYPCFGIGVRGYAASFSRGRRLPGSTWKSQPATRKPTGHRSGSGRSCASASGCRTSPPPDHRDRDRPAAQPGLRADELRPAVPPGRRGARDLPNGRQGHEPCPLRRRDITTAARDYVQAGDDSGLRAYSGTCLAHTWRYQEYADWWSQMFFSRLR